MSKGWIRWLKLPIAKTMLLCWYSELMDFRSSFEPGWIDILHYDAQLSVVYKLLYRARLRTRVKRAYKAMNMQSELSLLGLNIASFFPLAHLLAWLAPFPLKLISSHCCFIVQSNWPIGFNSPKYLVPQNSTTVKCHPRWWRMESDQWWLISAAASKQMDEGKAYRFSWTSKSEHFTDCQTTWWYCPWGIYFSCLDFIFLLPARCWGCSILQTTSCCCTP